MPDLFQKPSSTSTVLPPSPAASIQKQSPTPPPALNKLAGLQAMPPNHFRFSSYFRSMFEKPADVTFANQENDESIILLLHASFFTNILWILLTVFLLLTPPFLFAFLPAFGTALTALFSPTALTLVILSYYLLVFGYAYVSYIKWFYNVSIVSNLHVLDIEFSNISYKKVETITNVDIADVSFNQAGFFQTFFDFGTVRIDPSTQNNSMYFENVPKPSYVTDLILDLKEGKPTNG